MTRRVVWLCEYARLNGAERSLLATLPGLREAGYEITAVVPESGPLVDRLREANVDVVPVSWHDNAGSRIALADIREDFGCCLRGYAPDLVHANSLSMARVAGPVVETLGTPSIGHIRDIVGLSRTAMADVNRNDRLLCVSAATRDFHASQGLDPERAHVLFNGVDLERFQPRPATGWLHNELGIDAQATLLVTIGQIGARKGQDVLIAALPEVVAERPNVHVVIVGERCSQKDEAVAYERDLHATASAEQLTGHVHFLGVRDDVERILNESKLVVHAARQEPLGRVLLEAAASGCAIVATDVGGTSEIFASDQPSAVLVPPDDPKTLARAIVELIANDDRRTRLGAAARQRAVAAFDRQKATRGLADHYAAVIETARS